MRPALAVLCLLAGLLGGCGGVAPREVRWEVLGDALIASFEGGDATVRLESGAEVVRLEGGAPPGRRRLVLRGLRADQERAVLLGWEGGTLGPHEFRAGPAALPGPPRLAGPGRLRVRVDRPVELGGPDGSWRAVTPGEVPLEVGAGASGRPLTLRVREAGLEFRFEWSWRDVAEVSLEALLAALADFDEEEALRVLAEAADPGRVLVPPEAGRAAFAGLMPWMPGLLARDLPRPRGRALLRVQEQFQRLAAFERGLGLPARVPGARPEAPGERPNGFPPWPGAEVRELALRPAGQFRPLGPTEVHYMGVKLEGLGPRFAATLAAFRPRSAVTELHFFWPPEAPREGAQMAFGVQVENLVRETQLRLVEHVADEEPLDLRLWHPSPGRSPRPRFSGWLVLTMPAELAPRPGGALHLELAALTGQVYQGNEIRSVQVAWRTREGAR